MTHPPPIQRSEGSDYNIDVGLANTTYFTNSGGTFDIGAVDMVMIKAAGTGRRRSHRKYSRARRWCCRCAVYFRANTEAPGCVRGRYRAIRLRE